MTAPLKLRCVRFGKHERPKCPTLTVIYSCRILVCCYLHALGFLRQHPTGVQQCVPLSTDRRFRPPQRVQSLQKASCSLSTFRSVRKFRQPALRSGLRFGIRSACHTIPSLQEGIVLPHRRCRRACNPGCSAACLDGLSLLDTAKTRESSCARFESFVYS
jgi:hypothetical protein